MKDKGFNFSDVLGSGWDVMKANFWFFVGIGIVYAIVNSMTNMLNEMIKNTYAPTALVAIVRIILGIVGQVISVVLGIGIIRISLSFCDGVKPRFGTLLDGWDCFWRYAGTMILYSLIILGGSLLLVIPGIIWSVKFSLSYYFVIDKGLNPIEALKASARATMGVKWELFGFGILCVLIYVLGFICLVVGLFAAYPMVLIASTLVYRQLVSQTPELAELGIAAPVAETESTDDSSSNWR